MYQGKKRDGIGGNTNWYNTVEDSTEISLKIKIEPPNDPVITLNKYKYTNPRENTNILIWRAMHPYVYGRVIYDSQIMEAAQMSIKW